MVIKNKNKPKNKLYGFRKRNKPLYYYSDIKIRKEIELYEEIKKSIHNNLMCKCTYCGCWFEPTKQQIQQRINAINGKSSAGTEARLYCSNECKKNCPIYWQKIYYKNQKIATSREVQPELRQMVFERDNYTCQKCYKHKEEIIVGIHCHHKEGINWEPIESSDIDLCITLCETCHNKIHKINGCGYYEMRCK